MKYSKSSGILPNRVFTAYTSGGSNAPIYKMATGITLKATPRTQSIKKLSSFTYSTGSSSKVKKRPNVQNLQMHSQPQQKASKVNYVSGKATQSQKASFEYTGDRITIGSNCGNNRSSRHRANISNFNLGSLVNSTNRKMVN